MKTLREQTTTQSCCSSQSLALGQRLLLGCYVLLFALILPFICWGALAEPGHPHRTPHFVFADPVLVKVRSMDETADELTIPSAAVPHQQHHKQHGGVLLTGVTTADKETLCYLRATDDPVSGRATPTLLLFSILLLLLLAARAVPQPDCLAFVRWVRPPLPRSCFCAVPLPPPRLSHDPLFA